jgi:hypothetical protein
LQKPDAPSLSSLDPAEPIKEWHFQPFDFEQAAASDSLQVAIETGRRFDDAASRTVRRMGGAASAPYPIAGGRSGLHPTMT